VGMENRLTADQLAALKPGDKVTIESEAGFGRPRRTAGTVAGVTGSDILVNVRSRHGDAAHQERYRRRDGVRVGGVSRAELVNASTGDPAQTLSIGGGCNAFTASTGSEPQPRRCRGPPAVARGHRPVPGRRPQLGVANGSAAQPSAMTVPTGSLGPAADRRAPPRSVLGLRTRSGTAGGEAGCGAGDWGRPSRMWIPA
jgi:hypothetical protein